MPLKKAKAFGALLTDLSKAFSCLCHDFLITKLHTYGFDISSLNLLQNYLSNRKQTTKVESFLVPGKVFYLEYHEGLSFEEFLEGDGTVTIHHQNIRFLVIEKYKSSNCERDFSV